MKARALNVMHQKPSVLQPADLSPGSADERVCGCGFVSLLWLHRIIGTRLCLQCEHTSQTGVHMCAGLSAQTRNVTSQSSFGNALPWSRIPLLSWLLACTHFLSSPSVEPALNMDCGCFLFNNIWPGQELRSYTAVYLRWSGKQCSFDLMGAALHRGRLLKAYLVNKNFRSFVHFQEK